MRVEDFVKAVGGKVVSSSEMTKFNPTGKNQYSGGGIPYKPAGRTYSGWIKSPWMAAESSVSKEGHQDAASYHSSEEKYLRDNGSKDRADMHAAAAKLHEQAASKWGTPEGDRLSDQAAQASNRIV